MSWQFPSFSVPILFGGIISFAISIFAFRRRAVPGASYLGVLTTGAALWAFAYFLELSSTNFQTAYFWLRLQYLGIVIVPLAWFGLAIEYRGMTRLLTINYAIAFLLIPLITLVLAISNLSHGLIWSEINVIKYGGYFLLDLAHGPWFWVFTTYSYLLIIAGIYLLIDAMMHTAEIYRYQVVSLSVGFIAPLFANALYVFGWNPIDPLDLTVFSFIISGGAFSLAIFRFRLLDFLPIARERVIESLKDGVLVLDGKGRLMDMNASAKALLGLGKDLTGVPLDEIFPLEVDGNSSWKEELVSPKDILLNSGNKQRWVSLEILELDYGSKWHEGQVVVIHDISERKNLELSLQDQQRFLLQLHEVMRVAISSKDFIPMLQELAGEMADLFQADGCFITAWDVENQQTIPLARSNDPGNSYQTIQPGKGLLTLTESVILKGHPLAVEDIQNTPYMSPEISNTFPTRSMLAIPLIQNGQGFGAVLIGFNDSHEFTDVEIMRAEMMSQQVALAFTRIMSLEEAERRAGELESLQEATSIVAASSGREATIDGILAQLENLVGYDSAYVMLLKDERLEFVGGHGKKVVSDWLGGALPGNKEGPEWEVISELMPLIISDPQEVWPDMTLPFQDWVVDWMGVPLVVGDEVIGLLSLESSVKHFNEKRMQLVQSFADNVAIALRDSQLMEELQLLATIDELTGVYNRRRLYESGRHEFEMTLRYGYPLSVIMLDIDLFKQINDSYGHAVGDEVLKALANGCLKNIREVDIMGRYGGEEFVIILPQASQDVAVNIAERLRHCAELNPIKVGDIKFKITISLGVAEFEPSVPDLSSLIDRADTAMYQAKERGRNQVVVYSK